MTNQISKTPLVITLKEFVAALKKIVSQYRAGIGGYATQNMFHSKVDIFNFGPKT